MPELLNLGRLLSGHLFNELRDGNGWRLTDLNELHAAHNIAGGGRSQSHDGRRVRTLPGAGLAASDARIRQRQYLSRVACALMADTPPIDGSRIESTPQIVVLTGFMGSGKTTTGRALAAMLRWEFVDLDEWIERQEQNSIRELFRRFGETEFRNIEHRALQSVLAECSRPTVLALGGGTFVQARNDAVLRRAAVRSVFLEVSVEVMMQRCDGGGEETPNARPLASDPVRFRELYEQRLESYRRAEHSVSAERRTPEELALEIAERLQLAKGG